MLHGEKPRKIAVRPSGLRNRTMNSKCCANHSTTLFGTDCYTRYVLHAHALPQSSIQVTSSLVLFSCLWGLRSKKLTTFCYKSIVTVGHVQHSTSETYNSLLIPYRKGTLLFPDTITIAEARFNDRSNQESALHTSNQHRPVFTCSPGTVRQLLCFATESPDGCFSRQ
jgi:hypothetical protein